MSTSLTERTAITSPAAKSTSATSTATTFAPINNMTTVFPDNRPNPTGCRLPLIPRYNTNGTIVTGSELQRSTALDINKPISIAVDSESNLFVADSRSFQVLKYAPNSKKGQVILAYGTDRYPKPVNMLELSIDKNDLLYTYQEDSQRDGQIVIWPSSSKNGTKLMKTIGRLSGFTIDRDLNIYTVTGINLWIWLAPTYKESVLKRVFGKHDTFGMLPTSMSSIYLDFNSNLFAIDVINCRIQKMAQEDEYAETILRIKPSPLAIVGDCHGHLYTIDSNSSLIIYNSTGEVISAMYNVLDNPHYSDFWQHTYSGSKKEEYIPYYFATLALDSKNGDLYVIMYGYDRVTKFNLN